jgi:deoxyribodipyrimidine photo-lyase
MAKIESVCIFWFRRDLRWKDNTGLYQALKSGNPVVPLFIFDSDILNKLEDRDDARVDFIHRRLTEMQEEIRHTGSTLDVRFGHPETVWKTLLQDYDVKDVYTNHDYEPYAQERDQKISAFLKKHNVTFQTCKDQVIFERNEVVKDDGKPYTVYTPYSRKWMARLKSHRPESLPSEARLDHLYKQKQRPIPTHAQIGFSSSKLSFPGTLIPESLLANYADTRNLPGVDGTSKIGLHLRFGTVSIRELVRLAEQHSFSWLNELCWREFYMMILWHFPHVVGAAFKPAYDRIPWRTDEKAYQAWCEGKTGYPIVDAGMRELNTTGYMHNRVRMVVASFLTKHLLIDWRLGEAWFARKLLDFELSSNNGGWQWAAGSGCDAAPYFRVFNPYEQTRKFDPDLVYINKWVPEHAEFSYPKPIVDHKEARERCLDVYKRALAAG